MTIAEARKLMGKEAEKYSDEEVRESIETMQLLANLAIDAYLKLTPEEKAKYIDIKNVE